MAEKLITNWKLTINDKAFTKKEALFKLVTDKLQFKISGIDPLVIEKDSPSQQDVHNLYQNLKEFLESIETEDYDLLDLEDDHVKTVELETAGKNVQSRSLTETTPRITPDVDKQCVKDMRENHSYDSSTEKFSQEALCTDDDTSGLVSTLQRLQLNDVTSGQLCIKENVPHRDESGPATQSETFNVFQAPSNINDQPCSLNKNVTSGVSKVTLDVSCESHQVESGKKKQNEARDNIFQKKVLPELKLKFWESERVTQKLEDDLMEKDNDKVSGVAQDPMCKRNEEKTEFHYTADSDEENDCNDFDAESKKQSEVGNKMQNLDSAKELFGEKKCEEVIRDGVHHQDTESKHQALKQEESCNILSGTNDTRVLQVEQKLEDFRHLEKNKKAQNEGLEIRRACKQSQNRNNNIEVDEEHINENPNKVSGGRHFNQAEGLRNPHEDVESSNYTAAQGHSESMHGTNLKENIKAHGIENITGGSQYKHNMDQRCSSHLLDNTSTMSHSVLGSERGQYLDWESRKNSTTEKGHGKNHETESGQLEMRSLLNDQKYICQPSIVPDERKGVKERMKETQVQEDDSVSQAQDFHQEEKCYSNSAQDIKSRDQVKPEESQYSTDADMRVHRGFTEQEESDSPGSQGKSQDGRKCKPDKDVTVQKSQNQHKIKAHRESDGSGSERKSQDGRKCKPDKQVTMQKSFSQHRSREQGESDSSGSERKSQDERKCKPDQRVAVQKSLTQHRSREEGERDGSGSEAESQQEVVYSSKGSSFHAAKMYFKQSEFMSYFDRDTDEGLSFKLNAHNKKDVQFLKKLKQLKFDEFEFVHEDVNYVQSIVLGVKSKVSGSFLGVVGNKIYIVGSKDVVRAVKKELASCLQNQDLTHLRSEKMHTRNEKTTARLEEDKVDIKRNSDTQDREILGNETFHGITKPHVSQYAAVCPKEAQLHRSVHNQNFISSSLPERSYDFKTNNHSMTHSGASGNGTYSSHQNGYCFVSDKSNLKVQVYKANITELEVDCIVNAANKRLQHAGGVAKAISEAAGPALWKECESYTKAGKLVDVTNVFVSTGGKLPAKYVIHAVGPKWYDYDDKDKSHCFDALRHTVLRCLVEASRRKMTSVALPSISAAIFKVPKEHCARCYMEAVKHFDIFNAEEKTTLKEIHFVDVDDTMVNFIRECFFTSWDKPYDKNTVEKDCEFAKKHLSASKNETANYSRPSNQGNRSSGESKPTSSSTFTRTPAGASAVGTERKSEISAAYQFGKITLRVDTRPAFNCTSDITITIGKAFDKLSGLQDFKISSNLKPCQAMPSKKNAYKFVNVSKPSGKQSRLLCTVYPEPDSVEQVVEAFKNLGEVPQNIESSKNSVLNVKVIVLSSSVLYAEPAEKKPPKKHSVSVDQKKVGKFAQCLYDYMSSLSKDTQADISVTVVGSEEALLIIQKVIESRGVKRAAPGAYPHANQGARNLTESRGERYDYQQHRYSQGDSSSISKHSSTSELSTGGAYPDANQGGARNIPHYREERSENQQHTCFQGDSSSVSKYRPTLGLSSGGAYPDANQGGARNIPQYREERSENQQHTCFQGDSSSVSKYRPTLGLSSGGDGGTPVDPAEECKICYENKPCWPVRCCKMMLCDDCTGKVSLCPFCLAFWRIIPGDQPPGTMTVSHIYDHADGYENSHAWEIRYYFPSGMQTAHQPSPGKWYGPVTRTAYLPANDDGFHILQLLRLAFIRRLTFTIGRSLTRNKDDSITWNDIHHKTSLHGGTYGYPDPNYLHRVTLELTMKGVTFATATVVEQQDLAVFCQKLINGRYFRDYFNI